MRSWHLLSFLLLADVVSAGDECAPVATITETNGRVEIREGDHWQMILPLQPLCDGDEVRVGKKGRAVLTYLGFSATILSPLNSPYTVHEQRLQQSGSQKAMIKLRDIFLSLMKRTKAQSASLMTRGGTVDKGKEELRPVGPKCEIMLFPTHDVAFQWKGGRPPYLLEISEKTPQPEGKKIYKAEVRENSVRIPGDALREKMAYHWVVTSRSAKGGGEFQVLGKEDSRLILLELAELLGSVSTESEITRILIEYGFFIEKGFLCDAQRVQAAGEKRFSKNELLKNLALSVAAE